MMLIAVTANPLAVWLTGAARRLSSLSFILFIAGAVLVCVPYVPVQWILPVLALLQVFHLGSYAIGEAAILERVVPAVRGRVVGIFLTLAGTWASSSSTIVAAWTDWLGPAATRPAGYNLPFAILGIMMAISAFSSGLIAKLGAADERKEFRPIESLSPATMEPVA